MIELWCMLCLLQLDLSGKECIESLSIALLDVPVIFRSIRDWGEIISLACRQFVEKFCQTLKSEDIRKQSNFAIV